MSNDSGNDGEETAREATRKAEKLGKIEWQQSLLDNGPEAGLRGNNWSHGARSRTVESCREQMKGELRNLDSTALWATLRNWRYVERHVLAGSPCTRWSCPKQKNIQLLPHCRILIGTDAGTSALGRGRRVEAFHSRCHASAFPLCL